MDGMWRYIHATIDPKPCRVQGERCQFRAKIDFVPGMSRYADRVQKFWDAWVLHSVPTDPPARGLTQYYFYTEGVGPHLSKAIAMSDPSGLWWRSARGALERPATVYEVMHREDADFAPREGWTLVDGAEHAAVLKGPGHRAMSSEMQDEERREKRADVASKVEKARRTLARHSRGLALKKTLVAQWKKKLTRLEKRLASLDDVERVTFKGEGGRD